MKHFVTTLVLLVGLAFSSPSFATCADLFARVGDWLGGSNQLVRITTTLSQSDNRVSYTRGYLAESEETPGSYAAPSLRFTNTTTPPFNQAQADHVTIGLRLAGPSSVQVNYLVDGQPGQSVAYLSQCTSASDMIYALPTSGGVLAVSLRFDAAD